MLHDKHYPLPFCFMIDQSENLSAPVTDAWQIVYENELLCAMHSEGLQCEDGMSHYDLFCAAYPILINGSTASQRFYAKAEKLGVCPANAPDRMWKEINRCLEVRPITLGQFRYTGGIPAFGVRSASQEELLARMTEQSDLLAPLHKILAHARASGLRVVRVVFGAHPFFALPDTPEQTADIWKRYFSNRTLTDLEERIRFTDWLYLLGKACRENGIGLHFVCGGLPIRNTVKKYQKTGFPFHASLPAAAYADIASLYDYLSVRDALPHTLIHPLYADGLAPACAIASTFEDVWIGLEATCNTCLRDLPRRRTVLMQDRSCPAVFTPIARKEMALPDWTQQEQKNLFLFNVMDFLHR